MLHYEMDQKKSRKISGFLDIILLLEAQFGFNIGIYIRSISYN